jgi:acetyl-CoA carboxylase biotin carboxyl carrier protein
VELDFNELRELLTVLNQTDISEFTLKSGEFELMLRKGSASPELPTALSKPSAPPAAVSPAVATASASYTAASTPSPLASKLLEISSPMVGTFYRSPAPDESPFVDQGDRVRIGQTVCIIEAMKLMNEIEAEVAGEIVEILLANGDPVEYGQILMRVNPG